MKNLHRIALYLRRFGLFRQLSVLPYRLATWTFVRFVSRLNRSFKNPPVVAIYLRRGGGRDELVPGASDIDFFLVLEELDSQTEMTLLKAFWTKFRFWKKYFPFLGETLMADRNELANWKGTPTVRAFETQYSWKLLWGEPVMDQLPPPPQPELRDLLSECMKAYWALLKPLLQETKLTFASHDLPALHFRHAVKGALDIFRMHHSFLGGASPEEVNQLWRAGRSELTTRLPKRYGNLQTLLPLLELRDPLPQGDALFDLLADTVFTAYACLHDFARELADETETTQRFTPSSSNNRFGRDNKYSYAVRELFTERMILRHREFLRRTLISGETAHIFFPLAQMPNREQFREILRDLREAGTSFDASSVAIPLSEETLAQVERTSFLDNPFHAFHDHQSAALGEAGHVESSDYRSQARDLPASMLQKTFAEISLALRFQPPPNFAYVIENLINLVIQLRVAEEHGVIATDFYAALEIYAQKHPLRADYVKEQVGRYLNLCNEEEDAFWDETLSTLGRFSSKHPHRASLIKAQLAALKTRKIDDQLKAWQATTDLWTEITPFLRLEMNAMRDRFFPERAKLKL